MQIRYLYYVDNPALIDLYRSGTFLLYPSFYEASGLLHNEAMTFDCPVVVSDLPVMHEPCGDAALYCAPHDIASIVDTTTSVAERGYLPAKQFTLKKPSQGFLDTVSQYKMCLSACIFCIVLMNCFTG